MLSMQEKVPDLANTDWVIAKSDRNRAESSMDEMLVQFYNLITMCWYFSLNFQGKSIGSEGLPGLKGRFFG